eukprot:51102-Prymnesium_polylepis.1
MGDAHLVAVDARHAEQRLALLVANNLIDDGDQRPLAPADPALRLHALTVALETHREVDGPALIADGPFARRRRVHKRAIVVPHRPQLCAKLLRVDPRELVGACVAQGFVRHRFHPLRCAQLVERRRAEWCRPLEGELARRPLCHDRVNPQQFARPVEVHEGTHSHGRHLLLLVSAFIVLRQRLPFGIREPLELAHGVHVCKMACALREARFDRVFLGQIDR